MKKIELGSDPAVTDQELSDALRACRDALVDLSLCLKERQREHDRQELQDATQAAAMPSVQACQY